MAVDNIKEEVQVGKSDFKWVISNYSDVYKKCYKIESSKFKIIINGQITEWQLKLFPKGDIEDEDEAESRLYLVYLGDVDAYVNATFAILDSKNDAVGDFTSELDYSLFQNNINSYGITLNGSKYVFLDKKKYLPEGKLTILCEIYQDEIERYYQKIENGKIEDIENYGMLWMNEKLSDIQFLLDDGETVYFAHKDILVKKSSVFAAMFHTLETETNKVSITDISSDAFRMMLWFIYFGEIYTINFSLYFDLIKAAEKYLIEDLKVICEKVICERLTPENAVEYLSFADQHNAVTLKTAAMDMITKKSNVIFEKPDSTVKLIKTVDPKVISEILRELSLKIDKNTN